MENIRAFLRRQQFLCTLCKRIDEPEPVEIGYPLLELQPSYSGERRRRTSCAFCDVLWRALVKLLGEGLVEFYETVVLLERGVGGPMRADLIPFEKYQRRATGARKLRLQLFVERGECRLHCIGLGSSIPVLTKKQMQNLLSRGLVARLKSPRMGARKRVWSLRKTG
jgi:hypothetical protein